MDKLDEEYHELVPSDGWILKPEQFEFSEGESVFDLLVRVCKDKKIHLDHSFTPAYNSAYIKAIGNLYEFDCGDQSGWVYGVNGWAPNYGCSRYVLKNGDGDQSGWVYGVNGWAPNYGCSRYVLKNGDSKRMGA